MTAAGAAGQARTHEDRWRAHVAIARYRLPDLIVLTAVAGGVLAGIVVRLSRLGERVLSFDEGYTLATVQRSLPDMLAAFRFEANGTLYAILLWPLLRISELEAVVRTPAVVAGILTIPAVYWAGRELVGERAALVAAALVALSPAMIGWSVYGRGYPLATLFAVLSFGCLARALREDGRPERWRGLYVLAVLAMAYSSVLAAVTLLPVHVVAVASRKRHRDSLRAWGVAALALGAGLLPLLTLLRAESTYRDPLAWLWEPDLALVRRVGGELAAGPSFFGETGGVLAGAIAATLLVVVVCASLLSRHGAVTRRWHACVVLGWASFPPLFLFVASQVRPMFWGRYLGIVVPALALIVAVLLVRMPRTLGVLYSLVLGSLLVAASLVTPAPPNDFQSLGSWVETTRRESDPLVLYPVEQLPPLAYYARTLRVGGVVPVEEWNDTRLPAGLEGYRRDYDWGDSPVGPPSAARLSRLSARTGSVFVATYPNLAATIPVAWAETQGCELQWFRFDGLTALSIRGCSGTGG
ncbi:hypothetical protein BH09ACT13_BH09ACT13_11500 [soil metagenome]